MDKKFDYKPSVHRDEIRRIMRRAILTRSSIKNGDLNRSDVLSDLCAIRETLEIFSSAPKKAGRNTMSWLASQLEEACERLAVINADARCPSNE
ncbi:hypothetical protein CGLAMM_10430 [Acetobacteraceae bacterium EV16G]|uniref:Uncharacterized protein n=1 Tax=Sorlinia euscelidii TaxID=3081148 RepID=A0ABU7U1K6_9PROT